LYPSVHFNSPQPKSKSEGLEFSLGPSFNSFHSLFFLVFSMKGMQRLNVRSNQCGAIESMTFRLPVSIVRISPLQSCPRVRSQTRFHELICGRGHYTIATPHHTDVVWPLIELFTPDCENSRVSVLCPMSRTHNLIHEMCSLHIPDAPRTNFPLVPKFGLG
jgi:hypothetical protein